MTSVARHRTALSRTKLSRPLALALGDGLLQPRHTVLDYGCGRGDDLRHLAALGYTATGWDPTHRPDVTPRPAHIVNLGYVINVIEDVTERQATLRKAWSLTTHTLVVAARLVWDARGLAGRAHGDGILTRTGTFQKFYEQTELAGWIEQTLGEQPHAAAPGVFYIFRDPTDAQQFLANRVYTYRPRVTISAEALYERHHALLEPLLEFLTAHSRPPRPDELPTESQDNIRTALGSISRGVRLIRQVTDDAFWEQVAAQRRAELLIYIALSRFGRRPKLSQLAPTLVADIKAMFGTYRAACTQADRLLLAAGSPAMIYVSARASKVGKQTPAALYVHRAALAELPPLLQVYEGCARVLAGAVHDANMVKLSLDQPQVSYLAYPRFDRDAHPTLASAVTVHLKRLSVDWRDYRGSDNPPLLHRKEEFLGTTDPRKELYARLTRAEVRAGLYEQPESIGALAGWRHTLAKAGVQVRGHRLTRNMARPVDG